MNVDLTIKNFQLHPGGNRISDPILGHAFKVGVFFTNRLDPQHRSARKVKDQISEMKWQCFCMKNFSYRGSRPTKKDQAWGTHLECWLIILLPFFCHVMWGVGSPVAMHWRAAIPPARILCPWGTSDITGGSARQSEEHNLVRHLLSSSTSLLNRFGDCLDMTFSIGPEGSESSLYLRDVKWMNGDSSTLLGYPRLPAPPEEEYEGTPRVLVASVAMGNPRRRSSWSEISVTVSGS